MLSIDFTRVVLSITIGFPIADTIDNKDFLVNNSEDEFGNEIHTTTFVISSLGLKAIV